MSNSTPISNDEQSEQPIQFKIINKMDSPRLIRHIRTRKKYIIHHRTPPEIIYYESINRYFCCNCGTYIKPNHIEAHKKL